MAAKEKQLLQATDGNGLRITVSTDEDLQGLINAYDQMREERNAAIELAVEWADRYGRLIENVVGAALAGTGSDAQECLTLCRRLKDHCEERALESREYARRARECAEAVATLQEEEMEEPEEDPAPAFDDWTSLGAESPGGCEQ